jgi:hypothetical protein
VDKYSSVIALGLLDKSDYCIDDILVDHVLNVSFSPVEGEEAHAFDDGVVVGVAARAVDYVGDLVEGEPFDILSRG